MHTSATANAGITKHRGAELISGLSNRAEPGTLGGKQHGRIDDHGTYSASNVYRRVSRFIKGICRLPFWLIISGSQAADGFKVVARHQDRRHHLSINDRSPPSKLSLPRRPHRTTKPTLQHLSIKCRLHSHDRRLSLHPKVCPTI
jgi:hypothetical protein